MIQTNLAPIPTQKENRNTDTEVETKSKEINQTGRLQANEVCKKRIDTPTYL